MLSSSNVSSVGLSVSATVVNGADGRPGQETRTQAVPAWLGNAPLILAGTVPVAATSPTAVLPRELWWMLPADSRRQLQADHATFGDALLDPEYIIANASEAQMQARADYFALADHCNAAPCFAQATSSIETNTSASPVASVAFWCKLEAGAPWEVIPLSLRNPVWRVQIAEPESPLAGLNGRCFDNLEQIVGVMRALGMREVQPDASAMDEASAPRNCLHRAVLHLVRLCNGGTSS